MIILVIKHVPVKRDKLTWAQAARYSVWSECRVFESSVPFTMIEG